MGRDDQIARRQGAGAKQGAPKQRVPLPHARHHVPDTRCRNRSSATAKTMMPPVTISWTQLARSSFVQPLLMVVMIIAPTRLPKIEPCPPARLAPPITTAAMASSSYPVAVVGSPTG